jgi:hypothetical protein
MALEYIEEGFSRVVGMALEGYLSIGMIQEGEYIQGPAPDVFEFFEALTALAPTPAAVNATMALRQLTVEKSKEGRRMPLSLKNSRSVFFGSQAAWAASL